MLHSCILCLEYMILLKFMKKRRLGTLKLNFPWQFDFLNNLRTMHFYKKYYLDLVFKIFSSVAIYTEPKLITT